MMWGKCEKCEDTGELDCAYNDDTGEELYLCGRCSYVACGSTYNDTPESDCPDDDTYPCERCGEDTGNGYDEGLCCQCLGEC